MKNNTGSFLESDKITVGNHKLDLPSTEEQIKLP